jgi:P27 family predicted phage terminase small subunit
VGAPAKPSHLTPAAAQVWDNIMPDLENRRVVTRADQYALVLLCEAYSEYVQAREVLAEKGLTYETENAQGNVMVRKRPETGLAADSWRRAKVGLANFGLDPASRGRVESVPEPYVNEFDDV